MSALVTVQGLVTKDNQPIYYRVPETCGRCEVAVLADALSLLVGHRDTMTEQLEPVVKRFRGSMTTDDVTAWLEGLHG